MLVKDLPPCLASYGNGYKPDDRVDLTNEVIANMQFLGLDGLVVIGGDDTLSYGAVLTTKGVPVWGIPGKQWITMSRHRLLHRLPVRDYASGRVYNALAFDGGFAQ